MYYTGDTLFSCLTDQRGWAPTFRSCPCGSRGSSLALRRGTPALRRGGAPVHCSASWGGPILLAYRGTRGVILWPFLPAVLGRPPVTGAGAPTGSRLPG